MSSTNLRAIALTLLLATGCASGLTMVGPIAAEAAGGVRPQVGKPLEAAIAAANRGNASEANAAVRQAESVSGLTAAEQQAIAQTKNYIAAKTGNFSGGGGSATAAAAKFAADYNAGRYTAVTGEDVDLLKKYNAFTPQDQIIVAQAYYLSGRAAQAVTYLKPLVSGPHPSQDALNLLQSAAYKAGDNDTLRFALEKLVTSYPSQKSWGDLLQLSENAKGLRDRQTLNLYRLRLRTGTMKTADDYTTAAEMALEYGSAAEAANFVQKGLDAKVLSGDRAQKLLNTAKAQDAETQANFAKLAAAADKARTGDDAINLGEELSGAGRFQDAINEIQKGIQKGATDKGDAQIELGLAYLGAGQKDAAISAFNAVPQQDTNNAMIAHLWAIYAKNSH
ncbi:MAG TPA: tetratricopeptide repeat protein [Rhizomicrobium sp.]|nr:tetratricopeptide repeat protein [Rhizomicrobium sp.]